MTSNKKMTITFIIVVAISLAAVVAVWWYLWGMANPPLSRAQVSVKTSTPALVLGVDQLSVDGVMFNVEIASTSVERARGLSYRPSLLADSGMLFIFSHGGVQTFWMKDMHFPLDMIWISGNTVAGFAQNVPAPATATGTALWNLPVYASPDNVDKVLEVNAGVVAKYNIKIGDEMAIGPTE